MYFLKSSLFVDRFERFLQFWHLKFDKESISNGFMAHSRIFLRSGGGVILSGKTVKNRSNRSTNNEDMTEIVNSLASE